MAAPQMAEVLHALADALEQPESGRGQILVLVDEFRRLGYHVENRGTSVVIRFPEGSARVTLQFSSRGEGQVADIVVAPGSEAPAPESHADATPADLVRAFNDGTLTGEFDKGVGFDPDLSV